MSWSGTVNCRYCYNSGHNARTCPSKAERHKDNYERYIRFAKDESASSENIEDWTVRASAERATFERMTKTCIETGDKLKRKKTAGQSLKKMRCSYCGNTGHTRRTCQNLKNDYAVYKHRTIAARESFMSVYRETGAGIGSLISTETYNNGYDGQQEYERRRLIGMLTEIDWRVIDCDQSEHSRVFHIKTNYQLGGGQPSYRAGIEPMALSALAQAVQNPSSASENVQVHASGSITEPPTDWLQTFRPVKEVIDPKEGRPWCYRYNDDDSIQEARKALEIPLCAYDERNLNE